MIRDTFDMFQEPDRGRFGDNELHRPGNGPRVTGASDLVDIDDLFLRNDNPAKLAIAVSKRADTPFKDWQWLPRSLVEYEKVGRLVRVTLPERLAREKGLV